MAKKFCRKKDIVARSVAGAHLLVPVHECTRSVYTLNATGCRLWDLIALPRTEDELAGTLAKEYRIPHETARQDVQAFLNEMVRMNLAVEQE
jgi:hypothetical protein